MRKTRSALFLFAALTLIPKLAEATTALSTLSAATATNSFSSGDFAQQWDWSGLTNGPALSLNVAGNSAATNGQIVLSVLTTGSNTASGVTTYGIVTNNGHVGTSSTNYGLSGIANNGTTNNFGIYGVTGNGSGSSNAGDAGVWGDAQKTTGATYGVYGTNASSAGYAGYFNNTNGGYAAAFIGGKVGIGTATPVNLLDIGTSGGIHIASGVPVGTSMALYNNSGTLTWNGVALGTGSSVSGTTNYIPVFTGASSLGNSVIYQSGSNVGIGTATPQSLFHAYGGEVQVGSSGASCATANNGAIRFSSSTLYYCTGTTWTSIGGGGSGTVTSSPAGQVAYYQSTGSTVLGTSTLNISGGNVGIGTTTPQSLLHLYGGDAMIAGGGNILAGVSAQITSPPARIVLEGNGTEYTLVSRQNISTATNQFIFMNSSGIVGSVSTGTSSTSFNTTSDKRLKKNIKPVSNSGTLIDSMQPVTFDWADIPSQPTGMGMLAQDLYKVFPDAVFPGDSDDKLNKRSAPGFRPWGVDYSKLVPVAVAEIKSLRARAEADEKRLTDDEATIAAMKAKLGM
jgi:hypothetical protein